MKSTSPPDSPAGADAAAAYLASATWVDLSLTLSPELPCSWPNAVPFRHFVDHWFEDTDDGIQAFHCFNGAPYRSHAWIIGEHSGTHFDAPSHFLPQDPGALPPANGGDIDPRQFFGPAAVIDVGESGEQHTNDGVSPRITADDVVAWERRHGRLQAGDVVLFRSGWDERYQAGAAGAAYVDTPIRTRSGQAWPAPEPATMQLLVERGIRCVGTDGASMGPADDGAPTHVVGLSAGMVFIECLANLKALPVRGASFLFLPVKVARSSGGPGRAIALLPNGDSGATPETHDQP